MEQQPGGGGGRIQGQELGGRLWCCVLKAVSEPESQAARSLRLMWADTAVL